MPRPPDITYLRKGARARGHAALARARHPDMAARAAGAAGQMQRRDAPPRRPPTKLASAVSWGRQEQTARVALAAALCVFLCEVCEVCVMCVLVRGGGRGEALTRPASAAAPLVSRSAAPGPAPPCGGARRRAAAAGGSVWAAARGRRGRATGVPRVARTSCGARLARRGARSCAGRPAADNGGAGGRAGERETCNRAGRG